MRILIHSTLFSPIYVTNIHTFSFLKLLMNKYDFIHLKPFNSHFSGVNNNDEIFLNKNQITAITNFDINRTQTTIEAEFIYNL